MASFQIIMGPTPRESDDTSARPATAATGSELLDVVVDGERFSAATQPEQAACVLRELVGAALSVLEGQRAKALVPLCDAPWELCLLGGGARVALSLYRTGPLPEVRVLDRPVEPRALAAQARAALGALEARGISSAFARELDALVARLERAAEEPAAFVPAPPPTLVRWHSRGEPGAPVRVAFESVIAPPPATTAALDGAVTASGSVRADLHALLFRGRVSLALREQRHELPGGFVFLHLERMLSLCRPLLEAFRARRPLNLRVAYGPAMLGLRLDPAGELAVSLTRPGAATSTAPAIDPRAFARPVVDAALALARAAVRCDRGLARNLRLRTLRAEARGLGRVLHELGRTTGKLNADPAPYRASAVPAAPRATEAHGTSTSRGMDLGAAARLRYVARWRAEVEGLDLGGTLLCGDRLVVPGGREVYALDRRTGARLWTRPLPRAAMTLAGGDLLRLSARGEVELRDVRDGEVIWTSRLAPRLGAPALAFTVSATGLPPLVVLAEGERRLVALDLRTGEPRWRHTARHAGAFRVRRVGRLVVVTSGDASVTALDVASGEVVWRHVGSAPNLLAPVVHRETVLALAGSPGRGTAQLTAIDAFTGAARWSREWGTAAASVAVGASDVAALALNTRDGVKLAGLDLASGEERFAVPLGATALPGGLLALNAFDGLLVANAPTGRVSAVDAPAGELRWSRVVATPVADDTPRRMDAQLRAGALFVPQASLAVLRPRDGAPLADVSACDLVPDVLRVDEECALYVAEESGHVGCYELGARLSVVRT